MSHADARMRLMQGDQHKIAEFFCPGCRMMHRVPIEGEHAWTFDGDIEAPTLSPSILVRWSYGDPPKARACHSFVRAGMIEFLADCTHQLAGQTVPIPEIPEEWR